MSHFSTPVSSQDAVRAIEAALTRRPKLGKRTVAIAPGALYVLADDGGEHRSRVARFDNKGYPEHVTAAAELVAATDPASLRAILDERAHLLATVKELRTQLARSGGARTEVPPTHAAQAAHEIEVALAAGPPPGPWTWWTSCSHRRLSSEATGHDGDVLRGAVQRSDNHPDVWATEPTMAFIAAANPHALRALLAERVEAKCEIARGEAENAALRGRLEAARASAAKPLAEIDGAIDRLRDLLPPLKSELANAIQDEINRLDAAHRALLHGRER